MTVLIDGSLGVDKIKDGTIVDADVVSIAASKLTGALPAISGASLTNLPAGGLVKLTSGVISTSTSNIDIDLSSHTGTYDMFKLIIRDWNCESGYMQMSKLTASNTAVTTGWYGGYYRVGEGNTSGNEGYSNQADLMFSGTNTQSNISGQYTAYLSVDIYEAADTGNKMHVDFRGSARLSTGLSAGLTGGGVNTTTGALWGLRLRSNSSTTSMRYTVFGVAL